VVEPAKDRCRDNRAVVVGRYGRSATVMRDLLSEALMRACSVVIPGVLSHDACEIFVTPDGCEIYFSSNRPGGPGELDIFHSRLVP
jgi:hypothetical protein